VTANERTYSHLYRQKGNAGLFKKYDAYSTLVEIHNEQLVKEKKSGIAEKIKSTEQ
jgi:hypothetical protein